MYQNSYHSFPRKLLSSPVTMLVLLVIFVFIGYSIYQEKKSQEAAVSSINRLEVEIAELENKNLAMVEIIKYLKSDQFAEFEARQKLGYQKPDETVVLVPENESDIAGDSIGPVEDIPNYVKWLKYFFE